MLKLSCFRVLYHILAAIVLLVRYMSQAYHVSFKHRKLVDSVHLEWPPDAAYAGGGLSSQWYRWLKYSHAFPICNIKILYVLINCSSILSATVWWNNIVVLVFSPLLFLLSLFIVVLASWLLLLLVIICNYYYQPLSANHGRGLSTVDHHLIGHQSPSHPWTPSLVDYN